MMKHYVKLACFVGGALFGSAGVKLLASKDAKKAYTHITAAGLRMKDSVMAVSYTHLDVYKRQQVKSSPRIRMVTWRAYLVRKTLSSAAAKPPPTTKTSLPVKNSPSQVAQ